LVGIIAFNQLDFEINKGEIVILRNLPIDIT
jgi:hypothetical protein